MRDSIPTRRSVLKTIGTSAVAGTALTGTASASNIDIWVWRTTNVAKDAQDHAIDALENVVKQLNNSDRIDVHEESELSGNWPNDGDGTYKEYKQEFVDQRGWTFDGDLHFLIYREGLRNGLSFGGPASAGKTWGTLKSGNHPTSIANADLHNYDIASFKNIVRHEFLHTVVDGDFAPVSGNEHSFGTQKGWACENTPLLTGYAESVSDNDKPAECCNQDSVSTCDAHTKAISDCTYEEATYWLNYVY